MCPQALSFCLLSSQVLSSLLPFIAQLLPEPCCLSTGKGQLSRHVALLAQRWWQSLTTSKWGYPVTMDTASLVSLANTFRVLIVNKCCLKKWDSLFQGLPSLLPLHAGQL